MIMLLFIILTNTALQNAHAMEIQNISRAICDNIFMYYFPGPTVETQIEFRLEDGLNLSKQENFDRSLTTVFYFHGWRSDVEKQDNNSIIQALLTKGGQNVVFIDYSKLIKFNTFFDIVFYYVDSVKNGTCIGDAIGQFLTYYIPREQPTELIHLVSHSIGSQIMSQAAKRFGAGQLWLTALDPAGPLYNLPWVEHLNSSDGSFVDVIHTNAAIYGERREVGTVDFYPNGGDYQPGCGFDIITTCSHERSRQYYAESLLNEVAFPAKKCSPPVSFSEGASNKCHKCRTIYMGLKVDKRARGQFYLKTRSEEPFGMERAGLNF